MLVPASASWLADTTAILYIGLMASNNSSAVSSLFPAVNITTLSSAYTQIHSRKSNESSTNTPTLNQNQHILPAGPWLHSNILSNANIAASCAVLGLNFIGWSTFARRIVFDLNWLSNKLRPCDVRLASARTAARAIERSGFDHETFLLSCFPCSASPFFRGRSALNFDLGSPRSRTGKH